MGQVREFQSKHWYSELKSEDCNYFTWSGKRNPFEALVFRTENQKIATIFHGSGKRDSFLALVFRKSEDCNYFTWVR
jgi:hypothetical protein